VCQVVGDGAIDLFEGEEGEAVHNALGGLALQKGID
jgi:hypothetical protein